MDDRAIEEQRVRDVAQFEGIPPWRTMPFATPTAARERLIALEGLLQQPFFQDETLAEQMQQLKGQDLFPDLFDAPSTLLQPFFLAAMLHPEDGIGTVAVWIDRNLFSYDVTLFRDAGNILAGATGEALVRLHRQSILGGTGNLQKFIAQALTAGALSAQDALSLGEPVTAQNVRNAVAAGGARALAWSSDAPSRELGLTSAVLQGRSVTVIRTLLRFAPDPIDASRRALFAAVSRRRSTVAGAFLLLEQGIPQPVLQLLMEQADLQRPDDDDDSGEGLGVLILRAAKNGYTNELLALVNFHGKRAVQDALGQQENSPLVFSVQTGNLDAVVGLLEWASREGIFYDPFVGDFYAVTVAAEMGRLDIVIALLEAGRDAASPQFTLATLLAAVTFLEFSFMRPAFVVLQKFQPALRLPLTLDPGEGAVGFMSLRWAQLRLLALFSMDYSEAYTREEYKFVFSRIAGEQLTQQHKRNLFVRAVISGNVSAISVLQNAPYSVRLTQYLNGPGYRVISAVNDITVGDLPVREVFVAATGAASEEEYVALAGRGADTDTFRALLGEQARFLLDRPASELSLTEMENALWGSQKTLLNDAVIELCKVEKEVSIDKINKTFRRIIPYEDWAVAGLQEIFENSALFCTHYPVFEKVAKFYITAFLQTNYAASNALPSGGLSQEQIMGRLRDTLQRSDNALLKKSVAVSAATGQWAYTVFFLQYIDERSPGYADAAEMAWLALSTGSLREEQALEFARFFPATVRPTNLLYDFVRRKGS